MGNSNMESFEQAWERVADAKNGESVSAELRQLLQQVYKRLSNSREIFKD
jgi:hypothetical protein